MRIAVSGAQQVGKTTLVEALAGALPGYEQLDEPYWSLADEGYDAADPPTAEDFEAQLRRSIADIEASGGDVILDRAPIDVLAYLLADGQDVEPWIDEAVDAVRRLDLVVRVPIEAPDRVAVDGDEDADQRATVDQEIAQLLDDHPVTRAITVTGTVADRVAQVLAAIDPPLSEPAR